MIANIERQFLLPTDLRNIHYYFGEHRPANRMITHLRIQVMLGVAIGVLVLLFHFTTRIEPGLTAPWENFEFQRSFPYLTFGILMAYLVFLRKQLTRKYEEILSNSSGRQVDTSGVSYGEGHGFKKT